MSITVIIPVKDRRDDLMRCLSSVDRSVLFYNTVHPTKKADIIVVDDKSNIDLRTVVSQFSNIVLIKNNGIGPGSARNTGLFAAKGEIVVFIDSDCTATEDWITLVDKELNENNIYALQGNPCLFDKRNKLGAYEEKLYMGMFSSYIRSNECIQIDTRNCAFRRSILNYYPAGLFIDDMKQAQAEARVVGNRLTKDSIKIIYRTNIKVYHKDPPSLIKSMQQKYRHGSGRIYIWEKCPSLSYLIVRYFWKPVFYYKVPFWYVIPTHLAFIWGYLLTKWQIND